MGDLGFCQPGGRPGRIGTDGEKAPRALGAIAARPPAGKRSLAPAGHPARGAIAQAGDASRPASSGSSGDGGRRAKGEGREPYGTGNARHAGCDGIPAARQAAQRVGQRQDKQAVGVARLADGRRHEIGQAELAPGDPDRQCRCRRLPWAGSPAWACAAAASWIVRPRAATRSAAARRPRPAAAGRIARWRWRGGSAGDSLLSFRPRRSLKPRRLSAEKK